MDFTEFVVNRQRLLQRFATALTGNPWEADDIVATVLARAYEHWDRVSTANQVNAYVRRMVVNEFVSHRRRRRAIPLADLTGYADRSHAVPDPATGHAEHDALIHAINKLPKRQRAAIVLRYFEDMPDAEIADILGVAEGTVRSNIHRALASLRVEQRDSGAGGDPKGDRLTAVHLISEPLSTGEA